jgi:hypothetical protein
VAGGEGRRKETRVNGGPAKCERREEIEMKSQYVIEYKNQRIPALYDDENHVAGDDMCLITTDGHRWAISNGVMTRDGIPLQIGTVTIGKPSPQDSPVFQSLVDFDALGGFPLLSFPVPEGWD